MTEVAALAGVSTATVSRVLTGSRGVRSHSRDRVLAAVEQLNYHLNDQARGLRTRSSNLLALIIPDVTNPFFTSIARGLEDYADQHGYSVVLTNSDDDLDKERRRLAVAVTQQVAGVVIAVSAAGSADLSGLIERNIPIVTVDQRLPRIRVDSVAIDNRCVARRATRALLDAGRRTVGIITGPAGRSTAADRLIGYQQALRTAGVPVRDDLVVRADYHEQGGYAAAKLLLDREPGLDGLLIANNLMTLGALSALEEEQVAIPDRLMIAAFDELSWADGVHRRIMMIRQPARAIGRTAGELIMRRIGGAEGRPVHRVLAAELLPPSTSVAAD